MPIDLYQLSDKYLHRSNYWVDLTDSIYAAAFPEKLIVGLTDYQTGTEDKPDVIKFSNRGVAIPATNFFIFTTCCKRAYKCYQTGDTTPWEMVLFKPTRVHEVVAQYHEWESEMQFRLVIRWEFKKDKNHLRRVKLGMADAVDESRLENANYVYLKQRGCHLTFQNLEIFMEHLPSLIEACFFERDENKVMVLKFIDFVLDNPEIKSFVEKKLEEFSQLHYKSKVKILRDLLVQMFEKASEKKEEIPYSMKIYYDYLSSKCTLVYSLLNCHLKEL